MPIRKSIHVAFEQVTRSESLDILSDNLKHAQQQMDKTNLNSHEGYQLTLPNTKPKSKSKSKSKSKTKSKPKSILKKHSSLKSDSNPLTIARKTKIKNGKPLAVHFNDKVIKHKVTYWDPCGKTFPDYFAAPVEGTPETILTAKKSNKSNHKYKSKSKSKSRSKPKSKSKKKYSISSSFFSRRKSKKRIKMKHKKRTKKNSKVAAFVLAGIIVAIII